MARKRGHTNKINEAQIAGAQPTTEKNPEWIDPVWLSHIKIETFWCGTHKRLGVCVSMLVSLVSLNVWKIHLSHTMPSPMDSTCVFDFKLKSCFIKFVVCSLCSENHSFCRLSVLFFYQMRFILVLFLFLSPNTNCITNFCHKTFSGRWIVGISLVLWKSIFLFSSFNVAVVWLFGHLFIDVVVVVAFFIVTPSTLP